MPSLPSFKTIPFHLNVDDYDPILCFSKYNEYYFAGNGLGGEIIFSNNKTSWNKLFSTGDSIVKSLFVSGNDLYYGTNYTFGVISLSNLSNVTGVVLKTEVDCRFIFSYGVKIYFTTENKVFSYSNGVIQENNDFYGQTITAVLSSDKIYVCTNKGHIYSSDGEEWEVVFDSVNTVSSIRNIYGEPYKEDFIARNGKMDSSNFPYIYPFGSEKYISSMCENGFFMMGGGTTGKIIRTGYNFGNISCKGKSEKTYDVLFQGSYKKIHDIVSIDASNYLVAADNSLLYLYKEVEPDDAEPTEETEEIEASRPFEFREKWGCRIILSLDGEDILKLYFDKTLFLGTSNGRILILDAILDNYKNYGSNVIYSKPQNIFGIEYPYVKADILCGIRNRIIELTKSECSRTWEIDTKSIVATPQVCGELLSPILKASDDISKWLSFDFTYTCPVNGRLYMYFKFGDTLEAIRDNGWTDSYSFGLANNTTHSVDFTKDCHKGKYIQFAIKLCVENVVNLYTEAKSLDLINVYNFSISYTSPNATYFFTNMFELSGADKGVITANYNNFMSTSIKFGFSEKDSSNWEDYREVELNDFFDLQKKTNVKMGIKFLSYGTQVAEVENFAFMVTGDTSAKLTLQSGGV
jgi:hypothetical protein